jgi:[ribosomal protein S5]-alanine N-acetyltransferase
MFQLRSQRLLLRDLVVEDWQLFVALASNEQVKRWQSYLPENTESAARKWTHDAIQHNGLRPRYAYNLAITLLETNICIGWIGWGHPSDKTKGDRDFGYAVLPDFWNHGYMTEALKTALDFAFSEQDVKLIYGECERENFGSAKVMTKTGLVHVHSWQEENKNMERYAVTREVWNQSRNK